MRKIVLFTMIMTFIFTLVGCTAHNESDEKAAENSSSNAVIDITQAEEMSEKNESETVAKRTFTVEAAQPPDAETDIEKVSKELIFSQATTANTEPKQDTHTQKETPESGIYESEIKLQQILLRKSQQQLNKLKDLIYRIGFLTHRIMLKALV